MRKHIVRGGAKDNSENSGGSSLFSKKFTLRGPEGRFHSASVMILAMSKFHGVICVGASTIEAATIWYKEKLGLRESGKEVVDGEPGDVELISANGAIVVGIVGVDGVSADTPMFYTGNAAKAREWLLSQGVHVGPLQTDGQGTRYIEFRDLEDNMIEICEEP